jgi:hypothetical protein
MIAGSISVDHSPHPATRYADGAQSIGRLVATHERVLHMSNNQGAERFPMHSKTALCYSEIK